MVVVVLKQDNIKAEKVEKVEKVEKTERAKQNEENKQRVCEEKNPRNR